MRIDRIVQNNLLGCTLVFYNVLSVGRRWKNAFEKICCNRATYYISKCSNFNICQYRKLNNMSLSGLKQVLVDLSGTVHIEDEEVAGSIEAFERLRNSDLGVKFVTNTTKESKRELLQRLTKIGFDIKSSEIFTSLTAARNLVEKRGVRPMLMLDKRALEDFQGINTDNPNAVVVGLAPEEFNYQTMNTAFRLIMDGAPLIAIHKARYYKRSDGLALGPGPFVLALEYATGVTAEVVGKPEKSFFTSAVEEFHCDPGHCVMIGDDARDDINGATQAGMLGILVRTGKYLEGDENKLTSSDSSFTVDNFSSAVDLILKHLPNTCR